MSERSDSKHGHNGDSFKLELVGLAAEGERPKVAVQALDADGGVVHTQMVEADGRFALPADVLKRADRVALGAPDGKGGIKAEASITYRAREFAAQIKDGTLALAEGIWSTFRFHWTCVSGSVQVCRRRPWWFESIIAAATRVDERALRTRASLASAAGAAALRLQERIVPSLNDLLIWPVRCAPVCLGTVDVYRRTCCCWPIVFDARIPDLIRDLEIYVERLPKVTPPKRFPPPPPPPGDPLSTPFFKGGALNELAVNATHDLHALRSLSGDQAAQYIQDRPYLLHRLCLCSAAVKVGSGTIQPDGRFNICWLEPLRLVQANCYDQYAYVVKQTIGNTTTTIYDGLAANAWFAAGVHPVLSSYNGNAFSCNETGPGDGNAYVFLDLIGDTESHELTTPDSTGWDRVATPGANAGLLFRGFGPNQSHLRNLGGAFELTFIFSLGMRAPAIGATYYRISIARADASGNPTGPRMYYGDGLAWDRIVGADIVSQSLGPNTVGGESNLYRIPYSDEPWVGSVRYHALINTMKAELNALAAGDITSPAANHLITLEVFNAAGERLRPLGTPASGQSGTELAKAFKYRRWLQPSGTPGDETVEVPFAALTHLFCWDNRPAVADITRLVMNNVASDEECQFLHGPGNSTFAVEYRAYVPDERFQHAHSITWVRGLNGTEENGGRGALTTPTPSNVGKPPVPPANSSSDTFAHMLTRLDPSDPPVVLQRCSFAVTLTTQAKTTNGEDLNYPYAQEIAAFALAIE
jgi:hypothetical protein